MISSALARVPSAANQARSAANQLRHRARSSSPSRSRTRRSRTSSSASTQMTYASSSAAEARAVLSQARAEILDVVGDRVLAYPSASSVAPTADEAAGVREDTLRLTCIAGIAGLPAVSIPVRTPGNLPAGLCLVAAPGRDRDLLALAQHLAE